MTAAAVATAAGVFGLAWWLLVWTFSVPNFQSLAVAALGPQIEVLGLGSSRVFYGINPALYRRPTVSLAASYLDLASALALWELHGGKLTGLKAVVIEFDVATLLLDTRELAPYGRVRLGLPQWPSAREFGENFDGAVHRALAPFFEWRLTPEFRRLALQFNGLGKEPQDAAPGYVPSDLSVAFPELVAQTKIDQSLAQVANMPKATRARNLAALVQLLGYLRDRDIAVLLLRFPLEQNLRRLYPAQYDLVVQAALEELRRVTVHTPLPRFSFWDLSNEAPFPAADFRDPDHLNRHGAAHLAPLLEARLSSLLQSEAP